ncbi:hypothetical protein J2T49_001770 [Pseudomonas nitroreducens]|nr:hypothetical protein [Pseudomonas nitroreducens]MCP1685831.1 hypothetical protein [Pseudomonas nitroreducens]
MLDRDERTVTIPACTEHNGLHAMTITVPWYCRVCGEPRGEPIAGISFDGSRQLHVHTWRNPCGHVEKYNEIRMDFQGHAENGGALHG